VQLLLYRNPLPEDGTLVLKNPAITWSLEEFIRVFPEAHVVITHRDPYRSLVSLCTVMDAINAPFASGESPLRGDAGKETRVLSWFRPGMNAMERFDATHPGRALHLRYDELTADSTHAVQLAQQHAGLPADAELATRIADFLQRQRAGQRAAPPDDYQTYGYDHETVWADPSVARYVTRYGLQSERVRVVDVAR
jgi:hypothetical protein